MESSVRPRRDFEALEHRRKQAARMFARGASQASVVREFEVSRQTASRWYGQWKSGGTRALRGAGRAGRLPKLDQKQRQQVDRALRKGAQAHGFSTELWTLPRVAVVIEQLTGVRYHPGHVWRILLSMKWSLQRPAKRARERNEEGVLQWVSEKWPELKKTPSAKRPGSSSKTRAASRSDHPSAGRGHQKEKRQS